MKTPYPLIDSDPHASRVIRYFRTEDYRDWALVTVGFPVAYRVWELMDPSGTSPKQLKTGSRVAAVLGVCGGFLYAYQNSSKRFWGWSENKREEELDFAELSQRAQEGKSLYGDTTARPWVQHAAHGNSAFSQLKFAAIPMFNVMNHPYHGADTSKYGGAQATKEE